MNRAPLLALVLAAILPSAAADAAPKRPGKAVTTPRLGRHAIPKVVALAIPGAEVQPDSANPYAPPTLTAEELAVDVVEIDTEHTHPPQIGVTLTWGYFHAWGMEYYRAFFLPPDKAAKIEFYALATWADGRDITVNCVGDKIQGMKIAYGRWSYAKYTSEELGSLTLDQAGEKSVKFLVDASELSDWEYLYVRLEDADKTGPHVKIDRCTFTRGA